MTTLADSAKARSRLFQLIALGFNHPVEECHRLLMDGSYAQTLAATCAEAGIGGHPIPLERQVFAEFEARYIELFQVGRRGRPVVSLNAGDHAALHRGESRPDFLLAYAGWYRHFGLQVDGGADANPLPDHLVCQLEFMVWLAHLEDGAGEKPALLSGYRRAQRDFLQRHLRPFLEELVAALQQADRPGDTPFFLTLAALALEAANSLLNQLETACRCANAAEANDGDGRISSVNLWG